MPLARTTDRIGRELGATTGRAEQTTQNDVESLWNAISFGIANYIMAHGTPPEVCGNSDATQFKVGTNSGKLFPCKYIEVEGETKLDPNLKVIAQKHSTGIVAYFIKYYLLCVASEHL